MTPNRKKILEAARDLLLDSASDTSLGLGPRERLTQMAGRIALEIQCIEGLASSRRPTHYEPDDRESEPITQPYAALRALTTPPPPLPPSPPAPSVIQQVEGRCCGAFMNHKWANGPTCLRCGVFRA
jgi:hypothetical protein